LNNLASFLAGRDVAAARRYVEEGRALARRLGDVSSSGFLDNTAVYIYWLSGDWDEALSLGTQLTGSAVDVMGYLYLDVIAAARGIPAPKQPDGTSGHGDVPQVTAPLEALRARQLFELGDVAGAMNAASEALQLYHGFGGFDDDFPVFWTLAFDLAMELGDPARAEAILGLATSAPRGKQSPIVRALSPYLRARVAVVADRDFAVVDADFDAAATALRAFGAPYWLARCLLDRSEWLSRHGRSDEAQATADEAVAVFTLLGAQPWLRRAEHARAAALR
jgi:tetratricopeptide (TPR) repeat protein